MKQIYGNTKWEISKKCLSCKWRLRRITGGCDYIAVGSATYPREDDMYGCSEYEEL